MSTTGTIETTTRASSTYEIRTLGTSFYVVRNGVPLTHTGTQHIRYYSSRGAARKRISRERTGKFHN
jgi:hypothetical protein